MVAGFFLAKPYDPYTSGGSTGTLHNFSLIRLVAIDKLLDISFVIADPQEVYHVGVKLRLHPAPTQMRLPRQGYGQDRDL